MTDALWDTNTTQLSLPYCKVFDSLYGWTKVNVHRSTSRWQQLHGVGRLMPRHRLVAINETQSHCVLAIGNGCGTILATLLTDIGTCQQENCETV